jgi:hypothetical protein
MSLKPYLNADSPTPKNITKWSIVMEQGHLSTILPAAATAASSFTDTRKPIIPIQHELSKGLNLCVVLF